MTNKRINSPAPAPAVPWAVPVGSANEAASEPQVANQANSLAQIDADIQAITGVKDESVQDLKSLFAPAPTHGKSVFAPPPKAVAVEPEEVFSMEGAPSWGELVAFVQKHGKDIVQVRYPRPLGEAIDTIYRGVTVIKYPYTAVRHVKHGWIDWKDAIY